MPVTGSATFTLGAEVANARAVTVQLKTAAPYAHNVAAPNVAQFYLSSDAAGLVPVNPVSIDVVPTAGTNGHVIDAPVTGTKDSFLLVSNATGEVDVVLTNAADAAVTVYLNLILPNNRVLTSGAVAFLDDTP